MLNVIDCGARGGVHRAWQDTGLSCHYYMFEPEGAEFSSLTLEQSGDVSIINTAIADFKGQAPLNIYSDASLSSLLQLSQTRPLRYQNETCVSQCWVNIDTLENVCDALKIQPHFLNIDAQGLSLEILQGAGERLGDVLAIRAEAELFEFYQGQKTAFDMGQFLLAKGFELVRVETCGPGRFGVSSDMNVFSVNSRDAKPVWADWIFINRALMAPSSNFSIDLQISAIVYLLHNGCGYLAAELFFSKQSKDWLTASPDLLSNAVLQLQWYLSLPRKDYNSNTTYSGYLAELKKMTQTAVLDSSVISKLLSVYGD